MELISAYLKVPDYGDGGFSNSTNRLAGFTTPIEEDDVAIFFFLLTVTFCK
jgi:hypothetical protein